MINSGKYYLIKHFLLLTGLSDRTIRNYIKSGILIGEKTNGLWHFSQKQIELFLHNSSVRSAIKANNDAFINDFLSAPYRPEYQSCVIIDIPVSAKKNISEFLFYHINNNATDNIDISLNYMSNTPQIILKGCTSQVLNLANMISEMLMSTAK